MPFFNPPAHFRFHRAEFKTAAPVFMHPLGSADEAVPNLRTIYQSPGAHRRICHDVMKAAIDPAAEIVVQFCMEDDDAIARDDIKPNCTETKRMAVFNKQSNAAAFDHNRGLTTRIVD